MIHAAAAKSRQSCLTLGDPIDGSPPGSPIPEILQARTLEWIAISFSNIIFPSPVIHEKHIRDCFLHKCTVSSSYHCC